MIVTKKAPNENGRAFALRTLRENIIETKLKPGDVLSEKALADEMGLSRTPVREALIQLSTLQIVEILPQRGSKIALIDMNIVEEASFFRMIMEIAVAKLACKLAREDDYHELENILKLQDFYIQSAAFDQLLKSDDQFHQYLFKIANKMKCYEMVTNMSIHFDRVRRLALSAVTDLKIVEDHWHIYHAIRNHDEKVVETQIINHLNRYHIDEASIRQTYPSYFK